MAEEESRTSIDEEYETAYISDLDPNPSAIASDLLATEKKTSGSQDSAGYKTTLAQVAAFTCSIHGTCTDAGNLQHKRVNLTDYDGIVMPREFDVTFEHGNTYGDTVTDKTCTTITVYNKVGTMLVEKLKVGDSRGHDAGSGCWNDGDTMTFRATAEHACIINSDVRQVTSDHIILSDNTSVYSANQTYSKTEVDQKLYYKSNRNLIELKQNESYTITMGNYPILIMCISSAHYSVGLYTYSPWGQNIITISNIDEVTLTHSIYNYTATIKWNGGGSLYINILS